jgi:chromatin remodeling complex protein RSC6
MRKKYLKIKLYTTIKMVQTKSKSQSTKNVINAKDSKPKASKKTKSKKTTPAVEVAPPAVEVAPPAVEVAPPSVEATPPVVEASAPVVDAVSTEQSAEDTTEQEVAFEGLCTMVIDLQQQLRTLNTQIKQLQKNYKKEVKELKRKCKKPRKGGDPTKKRAPSGFAKPTGLTPELCKFLNVSTDTKLARTQVTKEITAYIKENSLQNQANKKIILPDKKLLSLLKSGKEEVTYFNLQKFMKVHFIKEVPPVESVEVAT